MEITKPGSVLALLLACLVPSCSQNAGGAPDRAHVGSDGGDGAAIEAPRFDRYSASPGALDLDGDKIAESAVSVAPCSIAPGKWCLVIRSESRGDREVVLANGPIEAGVIDTMGKHFGALEAVYVYGRDVATSTARVWIVDATKPELVAWVAAPAGWIYPPGSGGGPSPTVSPAYFAVVRGPDGRKHPFLAPGAGYLPSHNASPEWTYLCQFDPAFIAKPDPACGVGFRSAKTMFTAEEVAGTLATPSSTFRHAGGFMHDVDGDGWEDIHLPYLWLFKTISGRTGESLATTVFDVASSESPASVGFHSGRNYGSFATFALSNGNTGVLIAGANAVGTFSDYNCNVTRFHALLEIAPGKPESAHLAWARYGSFVKNAFAAPYTQSPPVILRKGDMIDGCTHRFSTSLFYAGGVPISVYSHFDADPPADDCVAEQYAEVAHGFAPPYDTAWGECASRSFLPAAGTWTVRVIDAETGASSITRPNAYAWGKSERLVPGGETVYLLEQLPGKVRFDRVGVAPGVLTAVAIGADRAWKTIGTFPIPGHPKTVELVMREGGVGSSNRGIIELDLVDVDGDGLGEVAIEGAGRVGWSEAAHGFVIKQR